AVLRVGEVETPRPGRGEVRVRLAVSGVNPSDVKSRAGLTRKIAFPRVIPHSDGAGEIDEVGEGVSPSRVGGRVWVWNGQGGRPLRAGREIVGAAGETGRAAARQYRHGPRSLSRHSSLYRLSGGPAHGHRGGLDRARRRRRGRGGPLRHPVREETQSH